MIVVADASPLVFLGKIRQLGLLIQLFDRSILVPSAVRDEVLAPPLPPDEKLILEAFFAQATIDEVVTKESVPGLSRADHAALTLAMDRRADLLLADDRLLRRVAHVQGLRPLGTLGILVRAVRSGFLPAAETQEFIRELVREHRFRISIEVYDAILRELRSSEPE